MFIDLLQILFINANYYVYTKWSVCTYVHLIYIKSMENNKKLIYLSIEKKVSQLY